MNRIGAADLRQIGKILEVPTAYFFEGAPGGWEPAGPASQHTATYFLNFSAHETDSPLDNAAPPIECGYLGG
jgi:hypothetical protein